MTHRLFQVLLAFTLAIDVQAQELRIAAAADLVYCLQDLDAAFKQQNPDADIKVSSGSSGDFFAQIQHGGPYDVFMSADLNYPRKLAESGYADGHSLYTYAVGRIVLWTLDSSIDLSHGLASLKQASIKHIAIANPAHAPYGRAAQAALQHEGLWDAIQPLIVSGENIAQTAQFVQSGNADVGIVAYSLLKAPKLQNVGHYVLIPLEDYPTMDQGAIVTTQGRSNPLAAKYLAFLATPAARAIFDRYGFSLPDTIDNINPHKQ
jgi:molybdate transport system substrate-binding protein